MSTITTTALRGPANPGSHYANYEEWLAERRGGITATEIAKLAKGRVSDRKAITLEKLTGQRTDISGNQYVNHGNVREPILAAWMADNFDVVGSDRLYSGVNPRHLATPDGISGMFVVDGITGEIKTSKHDLNPKGIHYATTGYDDQMQWQMHVMGGTRTLFVWEQHDDNWPDPSPVHAEPRWAWVERDQKRIDFLVELADDYLAELATKRPTDVVPAGDIPDAEALLVAEVIKQRAAESEAKTLKEAAWNGLLAIYAAAGKKEYAAENDAAKVSFSNVAPPKKPVLDEEMMRTRAPRLVETYENLVKRCTKLVEQPAKPKLSVTAKKGA